MKALVTGAAGFIGSHLCEELLSSGHQVRGLAINNDEAAFLEKLGVEVAAGDVRDLDSLRNALIHTDTVFHLAARVNVVDPWFELREVNVKGTEHMLQAAAEAGVARFVYFSSVAVYDSKYMRTHRIITEEAPHDGKGDRPFGYYARSKVLAEHLVRYCQDSGKLATTILRPAWVYGPRDRTIMPYLVDYLKCPKAAWIGRLNPAVSLVYVTDVAGCAIAAAENDKAVGQAYNIAPTDRIGVREFITELCSALGVQPPRRTIPYPVALLGAALSEWWVRITHSRKPPAISRPVLAIATSERCYDPSKAIRELGWKPAIPLSEGVRLTAEWIKSSDNGRKGV